MPATHTTTVGTGLMFREVMSGGFSLGESDPADGERLGVRAATRLVLHASLSIDNVAAFVEDAEHAGILEGTISFPPLGLHLPADAGRFKLFTRTGDPALKLMEYALTVRCGAEVYTLHGAKQVRHGSPFRGWSDTTTLPCRLHAGTDDTGPVLGAGILRISLAGFTRQLLSFRTVNGGSLGTKARALARFFTFFAGELTDSYLWPSAKS